MSVQTQAQENFSGCDEKLDAELSRILKEDKNGIVAMQFHVTVLKTAKKFMDDYGNAKNNGKVTSWQNFDAYLTKEVTKLDTLNSQNPSTMQSIEKLYGENAGEQIRGLATYTEELKNHDVKSHYKNEDVASFMLYDRMTNKDQATFDNKDLAITWFAKKLKERAGNTIDSGSKNLLEMRVQVNRYLGLAGDTKAATPNEVQKELLATNQKLKVAMDKIQVELKNNIKECFSEDGQFKGSCGKFDVQESLANFMLTGTNIADNLNKKTLKLMTNSGKATQPKPVVAETPKAQTSAGKPGEKKEKEEIRMCQGKPYTPKKGFLLRNQFELGEFGKHPHGIHLGPISCEGSAKHFLLQFDKYDKETCCNNRPTPFSEKKISFSIESDFHCAASYLIPFVLEVGIKGGIQIEGGIGGEIGLHEKTCEAHGCVLGEIAARPYLAIFVDAIAVELEGGIRWSPNVKASYCATAKSHPHFKLDLVPNTVNLYYKVELGWGAYSSSGEQEVYKTGEEFNLYGHDG